MHVLQCQFDWGDKGYQSCSLGVPEQSVLLSLLQGVEKSVGKTHHAYEIGEGKSAQVQQRNLVLQQQLETLGIKEYCVFKMPEGSGIRGYFWNSLFQSSTLTQPKCWRVCSS